MTNNEYSDLASGASFLCISIFCVVSVVALDLYRKRHILKFSSTLNGFRFFPIIGTAYRLIGFDHLSNSRALRDKFTTRGGFWIGHDFSYITIDPAEIKIILNHQDAFDKHRSYKNVEPFFGDTLLLAKFNRWKINRKLLGKCFSQPNLQSFVDTIYEISSNNLEERLEEIQSIGVVGVFENLTLDIFFATAAGADWGEVDRKEFLQFLSSAEKFLETRIVTSYFYPDFIAYLGKGGKRLLQGLKRYKMLVHNVLEKRREAFKDEEVKDEQKLTIVDVLLKADETLFDGDEIFREVFFFTGAATETSGSTLAFTFTLLGMNPHVQEKIYQEVETNVGTNGPITYNDLSKLKYTERAIRESMRLLPVTPFLGRHATADVNLGDRTIPAGSDIIISVLHLHRDETFYPNPLEYNPDRFLPEEVAKRHPYSYLPFSGGPRNCIGMKYAMLLMKMVVANVIRNYHVTSNYKSVEDLKLRAGIAMTATRELDCVFTPRIR